jgi:hypothetical protein
MAAIKKKWYPKEARNYKSAYVCVREREIRVLVETEKEGVLPDSLWKLTFRLAPTTRLHQATAGRVTLN